MVKKTASANKTSIATKKVVSGKKTIAKKPKQSKNKHNFQIVTDIDGVLIIGPNGLPNSGRTIKFLNHSGIPFVCLTNNGICTEQEKTNEINKKLNLSPEDAINVNKMFVCHTFMGSPEFIK